jgi:NADH-quinone oxidoreductase subunit L
MWRLWALTFMGKPRSEAAEHAHESPAAMTVVDDTLALLSIGALALGLPLAGGAPLERFLAPVFAPALRALPALVPPKDEGIPWVTYIVALAIAWAGLGLAGWLYAGGGQAIPARLETAFPFGYRLVANKFYVDELYDTVIVRPLWTLARWLWRLLDGSIDILLTTLPAWLVRVIATHILRPLQNGDTQRYATAMALGFATLLWLVLR